MTSAVNSDAVIVPMPFESTKVTSKEASVLNGREVIHYPPPSYAEESSREKAAKITLGVVTAIILIAGAVLWGVCNDPNKSGCSHTLHDTGFGLAVGGIVLSTVQCCFYTCICVKWLFVGLATAGR